MASGTTTPGQDTSETPGDSTDTGNVSGEFPAAEDTVASSEPAAMDTGEAPLADVVQELVEPATVITGSGDTAVTVTATPDRIDAEAASLPTAVLTGNDGAESASAVNDAGPAATAVAKMDDDAQDVTDVAIETVTAETGAADPGQTGKPAPSGVQDRASRSPADSTLPFYQLLASAREAYWLRDYQAAEDYYHQIILNEPDNPDGYGELGNMYFSQGSWGAAAAAYYEAGSRLVKSGLLAPARELVAVIRGLNGPQADALEHEIQTAQADSP